MPRLKKIYEYQWFKPYLVDVVNIGRRRFYKPTEEFLTKGEANAQGIYDKIDKTRRERKTN